MLGKNGEKNGLILFLTYSVKYEIVHLLQAQRDYIKGILAIMIIDLSS